MVDPKAPPPPNPANRINPPPQQRNQSAPNSPTSNSPQSQQERGRTDREPSKVASDRPQQKDIDEQRLGDASASGNWRRDEGEVIGENPASIDFVGAYPWPNVGEPGENRDDTTILRPPVRDSLEAQETPAEEQRRKSDNDARARAIAAERVDDSPLEQEYPSNPASAFRTQRRKDEENADRNRDHRLNHPAEQNRPHSAA